MPRDGVICHSVEIGIVKNKRKKKKDGYTNPTTISAKNGTINIHHNWWVKMAAVNDNRNTIANTMGDIFIRCNEVLVNISSFGVNATE